MAPGSNPVSTTATISFTAQSLLTQNTPWLQPFPGRLEIQLIQVVGGDRDALTDHLERHGAGVHHVGVYVNNIARWVCFYKEQGITVLQSGVLQSPGSRWGTMTQYAYLDTTGVGGLVLELIQIHVLGFNISSSRFWFELGTWLGQIEKLA
ncbi:MAG: VOC family protein [Candidatus Promineifilaceae bacterium]